MQSVSVIIRNLNEATTLEKVLNSLDVQRNVAVEVILVDNESTDSSVAVAIQHGARVIVLPRRQFSYGRALNIGLSAAANEICVLLSAHSLPMGRDFLMNCCEPFANPITAAARCVYVGKSLDLDRWIRPEVLQAPADLITILSKGPLASGCAIRRSVWEKIPFDESLTAAEEKLWAVEVVNCGHAIFSPCSAAYIYLKRLSPAEVVRKNFREIEQIYRKTGIRVGFAGRTISESLLSLCTTLCRRAPFAALAVTGAELLRVYFQCLMLMRQRRSQFGASAPSDARQEHITS